MYYSKEKKKSNKYVATVWCEHITTIFIFYIKILPLLQNKGFAAFWLFALSVSDYVKEKKNNTHDNPPPIHHKSGGCLLMFKPRFKKRFLENTH